MIFAAIDIGSNAGRLLVSSVFEKDNKIITEKITLVRVPLRLGFDVFDKGYITQEKQDMLVRTFDAYSQLMSVYQPKDFIAYATDSIRLASNGAEVVAKIKDETGIELVGVEGHKVTEIISKAQNANLIKKHKYSLYIDVGGGSTEISWFEGENMIATKSFDIGTVRLLLDIVPLAEWDKMKHWVGDLHNDDTPINCICSGGNVNKLTKLYGNRDNNTLSYSQLTEGHELLEGYPMEYRINKLGLRADRADVIVPAAIIFKKLMKWGKIHDLHTPKLGLADGLIIELYKKYKKLPSLLD